MGSPARVSDTSPGYLGTDLGGHLGNLKDTGGTPGGPCHDAPAKKCNTRGKRDRKIFLSDRVLFPLGDGGRDTTLGGDGGGERPRENGIHWKNTAHT